MDNRQFTVYVHLLFVTSVTALWLRMLCSFHAASNLAPVTPLPSTMFTSSLASAPLFLDTIPGIDPGPFDPGSLPGEEPDYDPSPRPDPDPDPYGPGVGTPGIDPGFPVPGIPGAPAFS